MYKEISVSKRVRKPADNKAKKKKKNQGPQTSCLDYSSIGNFKILIQFMKTPEETENMSDPCRSLFGGRALPRTTK